MFSDHDLCIACQYCLTGEPDMFRQPVLPAENLF